MVDLNTFVGMFGVIEDRALVFGAIFLIVGFFLGLLNRAAAYLVLGLGLFSAGSVILGEMAKRQSLEATAIGIVLGVAAATALYRSARLMLIALEFVTFFIAWFLLLYSFFGIEFTYDPVKVALWLVAGFGSLFLAHRASALLSQGHPTLRTNPTWKGPVPVVKR